MSCLHRGPFIQRGSLQRGRGLGSTLRSVFKNVFPAMQLMGRKLLESPTAQKILTAAKNSALEAGLNIATDALKGRNVGESLKENVGTAKKAVTDSLLTALDKAKVPAVGGRTSPEGKRERKKKKLEITHIGKKRRKIHGDIFD